MDKISTKGQMIEQADLRNLPHSGFDRSNHNYQSGKLGKIIPFRLDEVYPGDRVKGKPEIVVNFEPLAAPIMGSMVLKQESFFVPYPQIWRNAHNFFTGKRAASCPFYSFYNFVDAYIRNSVYPNMENMFDLSGTDDADFWLSLYEYYASRSREEASGTISEEFVNACDIIGFRFLSAAENVQTFASEYGVVDLLKPVSDKLTYIGEAFKYYSWLSGTAHDTSDNILAQYIRLFTTDGAIVSQLDIETFVNQLAISIAYVHDYYFGASSIFDYLGFPCVPDAMEIFNKRIKEFWEQDYDGSSVVPLSFALTDYYSTLPLNILPFRAYYLVWYWNYRDQLLEKDAYDPEDDEFTADTCTSLQLVLISLMRVRCWFKDTFTTALDNTGDGNMFVPAESESRELSFLYYDTNGDLINTQDYQQAIAAGAHICSIVNNGVEYKVPMNYLVGAISMVGTEQRNTTQVISLDLFDRVKRLRDFVQKRLMLGYEYDDVVYSSFLVKMSNVRMHIPELLGQGRGEIQINTIVNNTNTAEQIAGDKSAVAWGNCQSSEINYFSEEHGLFLSLYTVLPIQSYVGGLQRLYLKRDRLDFMWPEFATMGMDAVYNCELENINYYDNSGQELSPMAVFGYQGRYYDLKSRQDEEHGRMRTDLSYMTFGRRFDKNNRAKLNYIFVHCWPNLDMFVTNDPAADVFRSDCYSALAFERRLPVPSNFL